MSTLFTSTLLPFQEKSIEWAKGKNKLIFALDMGLGKTIISLYLICEYLSNNINGKILIICPKPLIEQWNNEILKHTTLTNHVEIFSGPYRNNISFKKNIIITSYSILSCEYDDSFDKMIFNIKYILYYG